MSSIDFKLLKARADFVTVLAHYRLAARGRGNERAVLCPFHEDKRPSLRVRLDRNIFHCFGCGAKGDILEFVRCMERTDDLRAAARKLAAIAGVSLTARAGPKQGCDEARAGPRAPETSRSRVPSTEGHADAPAASAGPSAPINPPLAFRLRLDPDHPYLRARGIDRRLARSFGLGYCAHGILRGRIAIPIHGGQGELVAYAGRWAGGDDELPEGEGKYKLPAGFHKTRVLFNLHRVAGSEHVVLVEGYFGAIRLHALGLPAAALMGRSIADAQIALLLASGAQRLTLLLDGDEAGRTAAAEMLPALAAHFFVRVAGLPDGMQPDTVDEASLRQLVPR